MADLSNAQKKEWAKTLYLRENLTQQEIAERVGVSRVTVSNWVRAGKWEGQKAGLTLTRQEQVANLYRQVAEINRAPYVTWSRKRASPTSSACSPAS